MNVASKELCQELYELSGWGDTFHKALLKERKTTKDRVWCVYPGAYFREVQAGSLPLRSYDHYSGRLYNTIAEVPLYSLGYLLRKLPASLGEDGDYGFGLGYSAGYKPGEYGNCVVGYYNAENSELFKAFAAIPEDAAAQLAIELFKQGLIEEASSGTAK